MNERRRNKVNRERFEALRGALAARLARVCRDMPRRELDRLTTKMTRLYLKYEPMTGMPEPEPGRRDSAGA